MISKIHFGNPRAITKKDKQNKTKNKTIEV